jgi:hypothetical protein
VTRQELEHAIRAACDVADDHEVWVFGSQAILGEHPDAPASLRQSAEVDVAPRNHPQRADNIDGALGELSPFHEAYGFYVHGLPIDAATLPEGWQRRTIPVSGLGARPATGFCLEAHDLAASKLAAFREKDRRFVRTLIVEGLVDSERLLARVRSLGIDENASSRLQSWIRTTAQT